MRCSFLLLMSVICLNVAPAHAKTRGVNLGTCPAAHGGTIKNCRVAYTDYGKPNKDFSNVIVVPTWLSGRSDQFASFLRIADDLKDIRSSYLIVVDALGNGLSSSPANDDNFPEITIENMVWSQHKLLKKLGINHVRAILGLSMGGLQALQWSVQYPGFMDKIVNVAGTPRATPDDVTLWYGQLRALDATELSPKGFNHNMRSQLLAMMSHDMAPGESYDDIAARIQAEVLTIVSRYDLLVDPEPSRLLAAALGGEVIETNSLCGHFSPAVCTFKETRAAIEAFIFAE